MSTITHDIKFGELISHLQKLESTTCHLRRNNIQIAKLCLTSKDLGLEFLDYEDEEDVFCSVHHYAIALCEAMRMHNNNKSNKNRLMRAHSNTSATSRQQGGSSSHKQQHYTNNSMVREVTVGYDFLNHLLSMSPSAASLSSSSPLPLHDGPQDLQNRIFDSIGRFSNMESLTMNFGSKHFDLVWLMQALGCYEYNHNDDDQGEEDLSTSSSELTNIWIDESLNSSTDDDHSLKAMTTSLPKNKLQTLNVYCGHLYTANPSVTTDYFVKSLHRFNSLKEFTFQTLSGINLDALMKGVSRIVLLECVDVVVSISSTSGNDNRNNRTSNRQSRLKTTLSNDTIASLARMPNLKTLRLNHNHLGDSLVLGIAAQFRENNFASLQELELDNNCLGHPSGVAIADILLNKTSSLQYLSLNANVLGDDAIIEIAKSLRDNTTLRSLQLSQTYMGNPGCIALANSIRFSNRYLQELDVTHNHQITHIGYQALIDAVEHNFAIQNVSVVPPCFVKDCFLHKAVDFYTFLNVFHRCELLTSNNITRSQYIEQTIIKMSNSLQQQQHEKDKYLTTSTQNNTNKYLVTNGRRTKKKFYWEREQQQQRRRAGGGSLNRPQICSKEKERCSATAELEIVQLATIYYWIRANPSLVFPII